MDDEQTKGTPEKEPIEEVFRQCESPLLAYAMKMVQDGEQAQEIVQEGLCVCMPPTPKWGCLGRGCTGRYSTLP